MANNSRKHSIELSDVSSTFTTLPTTTPAATTSILSKRSKQNVGPKKDEIWEYYVQGKSMGNRRYETTCHHCGTSWARGKPSAMKVHLANECAQCPEDISQYWHNKLANQIINYIRDPKKTAQEPKKQRSITQHFGSDKPLPPETTRRLDRSLLKAWVIAGIPWVVIDNPFIKNLFKDLNPGYVPPSRTTLSGRLLDQEIARINQRVDQELENVDHLTLCKYLFTFYSVLII